MSLLSRVAFSPFLSSRNYSCFSLPQKVLHYSTCCVFESPSFSTPRSIHGRGYVRISQYDSIKISSFEDLLKKDRVRWVEFAPPQTAIDQRTIEKWLKPVAFYVEKAHFFVTPTEKGSRFTLLDPEKFKKEFLSKKIELLAEEVKRGSGAYFFALRSVSFAEQETPQALSLLIYNLQRVASHQIKLALEKRTGDSGLPLHMS